MRKSLILLNQDVQTISTCKRSIAQCNSRVSSVPLQLYVAEAAIQSFAVVGEKAQRRLDNWSQICDNV